MLKIMEKRENMYKCVPNFSVNVTDNADDQSKCTGNDGEVASYVCKICDLNLASSDALNNHLHSLHVVKSSDSFFCGCHPCSETFQTSSLLIDHLRREHTVQKLHSCGRCGKKLDHFYDVPTHFSNDPPSNIYCIVCVTELENVEDKDLIVIKVEKNEESTLESVPNNSSNVNDNAADHLKSAGGGGKMESYVCKICDLNLSSSDDLNNHLYSLHAVRSGDSLSCGYHPCSEIFQTSSLLEDHLRREHTVQNFSSCGRCGKELTRTYSVPTHCSNDPPSKIYCIVCVMKLQNIKDKDLEVIKLENNEKSTLKSVPNVSLNIIPTNNGIADQSISAGNHFETSDSYMCQLCQMQFSSSDALDDHFHSSHVVTRFSCGSCNKYFKRLQMLMNHLRRDHTAQMVNFCSKCGQKLTSYRSVTIHRRGNELPKIYCGGCMTEGQNESSLVAEVVKEETEGNASESNSDIPTNMISCNNDVDESNNASNDDETDPYFCQICQQGVPSSDALNDHLSSSHVARNGKNCFTCSMCEKAFKSNFRAINHLRRHHTLQKIYFCGQCGKKLTTCHSVPTHDRRQEPSAIYCSVCIMEPENTEGKSVEVSKEKSCVQGGHVLVDKERRLVCDICSKKFWKREEFLYHQRNTCSIIRHPCDVCGKTFSTANNLKRHLLSHSGEKPYLCDTCGKGFTQKHTLIDHQRSHTGERPYGCETCGKRFACKNSLKIHHRNHTREKSYVCDFCCRKFVQQDKMREHRRLHTEEKLFECGICAEKYGSQEALSEHRSKHGDSKLSCDICLKVFSSTGALVIHKRTHTGEKPYSCVICGRKFASGGSRQAHMRIHTGERPYVCEACGKGFTQKPHLLFHLRVHTGEKPHMCDICERSFAHSSNLLAHRRIHTGERPFRCGVCQKGFVNKRQLKKHQRTHDRD